MADHLREALEKVLDAYDARRAAEGARVRKLEEEAEAFQARFRALRKDVVRPVLEAAGAILAERGHSFSITEEEYSASAGERPVEAGISLRLAPAGSGPAAQASDHTRTFSVSTRHYNRMVNVDAGAAMSEGGMVGSKADYPPERVDRQLIEEALVRFVAGVVR
jgi:hypothetical protein